MPLTRLTNPIVTVNANITVTPAHQVVFCNSASAFTITLYSATGNAGRSLLVRNNAGGTATVAANNGQTIDSGSSSVEVWGTGGATQFYCDGVGWKTDRQLLTGSSIFSRHGYFGLHRNLTDDAGRRNWCITNEVLTVGDFHIRRSTTNTGSPDTTVLQITGNNLFSFNSSQLRMNGGINVIRGHTTSVANGATVYLCSQQQQYFQDFVIVHVWASAGWNRGGSYQVMLDGYGATTPTKLFASAHGDPGALSTQIATNASWLAYTNNTGSTLNSLKWTILHLSGQQGSTYWLRCDYLDYAIA